MGVDVSHIIRHDFHEIHDHEKALDFVKETIEVLKDRLQIKCSNQKFELDDEYIDPDPDWRQETITFRLPLYELEFTLHNGFWLIESFFHYCQLLMPWGDSFLLRELTFDVAQALGQSEAWYAEEFYTWNGYLDETGSSFEDWVSHAEKKYGKPIPEFSPELFIAQGNVGVLEYEPLYHDSFKEYQEKMHRYRSMVAERGEVLGLHLVSGRFVRCRVGDGINLFDMENREFLFDNPVECILKSFAGNGFVVVEGEKQAVFDADGKQLTDYVPGELTWI